MMKVPKYKQKLPGYSLAFLLRESPIILTLQIGMQRFSLGIFHDKEYLLTRVYAFIELDDVWVMQLR